MQIVLSTIVTESGIKKRFKRLEEKESVYYKSNSALGTRPLLPYLNAWVIEI